MNLNILITGSEGYLGQRLISRLAEQHNILGIDIRVANPSHYHYQQMDIREPALRELINEHSITHVVHLASVMQASADRQWDFDIDVNGTRNVLDACVAGGVRHLTVTSSGAAYGYHEDNPAWLSEHDPLRGNDSFAYSCHKRLIEEMLARYRSRYSALKQLVLRPGTVLGQTTQNQITNLFDQKRIMAVKGSPSPFVFIWDEDVVEIIRMGVCESKCGQFNLAGDGAMTLVEIAEALNKPLVELPPWLLKFALTLGHSLGLTQYSAEQLEFLRYRPVLDNRALKQDFGYTPIKSSREVFDFYLKHNREQR
ncbi:SDR family oxidoreductase [Aliiglaciecola sp. LCG003]|uniref:SDR family oxidoreductase n=1 Tax=Aliiglaciecola sp. LCG003 TaxID=3053655 RepID=UPI002573BDE4|nr:SDR family oxidoreductase [Aliiglaciecola sp. LCG003]WJG10282.1 SDR family oxidoreductase [Aliiglaciecola sp. LCG003]